MKKKKKNAASPSTHANIDTTRAELTETVEMSPSLQVSLRTTGMTFLYGRGVNQDAAKARHYFLQAAQGGDAISQGMLGLLYKTGQGCPKNPKAAFAWTEKAAAQNSREAMCEMGNLYANGIGVEKDMTLALEWYTKAYEAGSPEAMLSLGLLYEQGTDVPKDAQKGLELIQSACDKNYPPAFTQMGRYYENGVGVEKDLAKARTLYEKAARANNGDGQYKLAGMLADELYTNKDALGLILELLQKSAANMNSLAQVELAYLYEHGLFGKVEVTAAEKFLKIAERSGLPAAIYSLARLHHTQGKYAEAFRGFSKSYENKPKQFALPAMALACLSLTGQGCIKNPARAAKYCQEAIEDAYAPANTLLGWLYETGTGVPQDFTKAAECYEKAEMPEAFVALGRLLKDGRGVEQNADKARELFEKAMNLQEGDAAYELGRYYEHGSFTEEGNPENVDLQKACTYYALASMNSYIGCLAAARCYKEGIGTEANASLALYYEKQAEALKPRAQKIPGAAIPDLCPPVSTKIVSYMRKMQMDAVAAQMQQAKPAQENPAQEQPKESAEKAAKEPTA